MNKLKMKTLCYSRELEEFKEVDTINVDFLELNDVLLEKLKFTIHFNDDNTTSLIIEEK